MWTLIRVNTVTMTYKVCSQQTIKQSTIGVIAILKVKLNGLSPRSRPFFQFTFGDNQDFGLNFVVIRCVWMFWTAFVISVG